MGQNIIKKKNEIVLKAETELIDKEARGWINEIWSKIQQDLKKINDRTKIHTLDIKNIEKRLKLLENRKW